MIKRKTDIALDSNVFRNSDFIDYLILKKTEFNIFIPMIVQLEVGYFYLSRGISWEDFERDIKKFDGRFTIWNNKFAPEVVKRAFNERNYFPFKHHFRDFMIGIECEKISANLITYNKAHFDWLLGIECYTPEEYIQSIGFDSF